MIRLRSENLWVRLGRITYDTNVVPPDRTNICSVFWRGLGGVAIVLGSCAMVGFVIAAVIAEIIYAGFLAVLWIALGLVGLVAGVFVMSFALAGVAFGITMLWQKRGWRKPKMPRLHVKERVTNTVPAQAFKSWKERHCALVRIED